MVGKVKLSCYLRQVFDLSFIISYTVIKFYDYRIILRPHQHKNTDVPSFFLLVTTILSFV